MFDYFGPGLLASAICWPWRMNCWRGKPSAVLGSPTASNVDDDEDVVGVLGVLIGAVFAGGLSGRTLSWLLHLNDNGGWQSQLLEVELAVAAVLGFVLLREADLAVSFSPLRSLRVDRRTVVALAIIGGLAAGAMAGHVDYYGHFRPPRPDLLYGTYLTVVWGVTTGLALGLVAGEWWQWCVARCWLGLNTELPLRSMRFLDDARGRGLLRQAGGGYEFRHRVIRDYLVNPQSPTPVVSAAPTG